MKKNILYKVPLVARAMRNTAISTRYQFFADPAARGPSASNAELHLCDGIGCAGYTGRFSFFLEKFHVTNPNAPRATNPANVLRLHAFGSGNHPPYVVQTCPRIDRGSWCAGAPPFPPIVAFLLFPVRSRATASSSCGTASTDVEGVGSRVYTKRCMCKQYNKWKFAVRTKSRNLTQSLQFAARCRRSCETRVSTHSCGD